MSVFAGSVQCTSPVRGFLQKNEKHIPPPGLWKTLPDVNIEIVILYPSAGILRVEGYYERL